MLTIFLLFLQVPLTNGQPTNPSCAVTHDSKGWHYNIVGENKIPCPRYDWTRKNHVLANYKQANKSNEIQQWNNTYLHLSVCMEDIQRNRDCPREQSVQVIICTVNCTGIFPIHSSTGRRHVLVIPPLLFFLLLLLLLLACQSRCCKRKNRQGLCPCCYTARPK